MIENDQVERLGRARQFSGCATVSIARSRLAARVIVSENQSRASATRRIDDDFPDRHAYGVWLSIITFDMHAARGIIDVGHPQPFAGIAVAQEARRKEAASGFMSIQYRGKFSTLEPHAAILSGVRRSA
jgi:hypothetical protein